MTDKEILDQYIALVPFLAETFGSSCEVLIHDLTDRKSSVVAIANGFNSGRAIGSPITELARRLIDDGAYKDKDYLSNYSGLSKEKHFRSGTFFIKNEGRLIGLLCINRNVDALNTLTGVFEQFMRLNNLMPANVEIQEELSDSVESILHSMVRKTIEETGLLPSRMSMNDKVKVVHRLQEQGIMKLKGAVAEIAAQMNISEPTVYRYLNKRADAGK